MSSKGTDQVFLAGVTLPSTVQGRAVKVDSFELCYDAGSSAVLFDVFLGRTFATASESGVETLINDEVDRTDTTCRTYSAGNPISLDPTQGVVVGVHADYPSGPNEIVIFRLIVNLST